jgi:hypothetical protein
MHLAASSAPVVVKHRALNRSGKVRTSQYFIVKKSYNILILLPSSSWLSCL